jgi:hypothetical protein
MWKVHLINILFSSVIAGIWTYLIVNEKKGNKKRKI